MKPKLNHGAQISGSLSRCWSRRSVLPRGGFGAALYGRQPTSSRPDRTSGKPERLDHVKPDHDSDMIGQSWLRLAEHTAGMCLAQRPPDYSLACFVNPERGALKSLPPNMMEAIVAEAMTFKPGLLICRNGNIPGTVRRNKSQDLLAGRPKREDSYPRARQARSKDPSKHRWLLTGASSRSGTNKLLQVLVCSTMYGTDSSRKPGYP